LHIEEVTELTGIEEIIPTKIEELEDGTQSQDEPTKTIEEDKQTIQKVTNLPDIQIKENQKKDIDNRLAKSTKKRKNKTTNRRNQKN